MKSSDGFYSKNGASFAFENKRENGGGETVEREDNNSRRDDKQRVVAIQAAN